MPVSAFAALLLLAGCATTPHRMYAGPPLRPGQTARIEIRPGYWKHWRSKTDELCDVIAIDGQATKRRIFTSTWAEIAPGNHSATVQLHTLGFLSKPRQIEWTAVAGRAYRITADIIWVQQADLATRRGRTGVWQPVVREAGRY